VKRFIANVRDGALEAGYAKGKRRLRFKVKVTDVRGSKTRLVVRARQ
jgi:hypothetical protein